jgi:hypothetical protein
LIGLKREFACNMRAFAGTNKRGGEPRKTRFWREICSGERAEGVVILIAPGEAIRPEG